MTTTYRTADSTVRGTVTAADPTTHTHAASNIGTSSPTATRYVLAALRVSMGWVFLWAFLDKAFALGFSTGRNADTGVVDRFGPAAWIHGGSPTNGFLSFGTKGPFASFYQSIAGTAWADSLFMMALLGIGIALVLGIGMRVAAVAGPALLVMMWSAALPPETNPFMDDHLIYALAIVTLTLVGAGHTFGLGNKWDRVAIVKRFGFLR